MSDMTGSRFLAETLRGYGVTTIFFVPSILHSALVEMEKLGIKRVMCHSEKAAAYMADGYARALRRPGIAMAQSVGAANLAAGLQDAYLASSPVIAITGRWPAVQKDRHAYQEINHWPIYEPVTKYNTYVDGVDHLPSILSQAFREATSGSPGPVHLDVLGIMGQSLDETKTDLKVVVEEQFSSYPAFRPAPEPERVKEAVSNLLAATKPVIVAGGGVTASNAGAEVVKLAEILSLPVATSLNGKGVIPEDHPLSIGVVGSYSRRCANQIVSEADLVLFVGSHTGGQVTNYWKIPETDTATIQINIDPSEIGRSYPVKVPLLGDAKVALSLLIEDLGEKVVKRPEWIDRVHRLVSAWRKKATPTLKSNAEPIRPERLCQEISQFLPENAILVSDTGHAGIWTGTMIELTETGQSYLRCAGSLGWAFPAALGAKCAAPDRPVICFTGDGGFWYHMSELETAVRCGINTVTIVNNNRSLNQCQNEADEFYGNYQGNREEIWVFSDINFAEIAESMGCLGIRVEHPQDLKKALQKAVGAEKPVVIDVVSDIKAMADLPYAPE